MDALAIAASGMRSAELRLFASAHNTANFTTPSFRPLRTVQSTAPGGGSLAHLEQSPREAPVSLVREVAEQIRASTQFRASLRVFAVSADVRGSLVDLVA